VTGGATDRPEPVVLPGHGVFIPATACAALASVLTLVLGRRRPPAVAQRQGGALAAIRDAAHTAAVEHHRVLHRAAAAGHDPVTFVTESDPLSSVGSGAKVPALSGREEVTPAVAARIIGYTAQWVRRLARAGDLDGWQDDSGRWFLDKRSVNDYAQRGRNGSNDHS
jgi:hypothetical protein